jgi:hypothetical protein
MLKFIGQTAEGVEAFGLVRQCTTSPALETRKKNKEVFSFRSLKLSPANHVIWATEEAMRLEEQKYDISSGPSDPYHGYMGEKLLTELGMGAESRETHGKHSKQSGSAHRASGVSKCQKYLFWAAQSKNSISTAP